MFNSLKIILGALTIAFLAYVKYLKMTNESQKKNIARLKRENSIAKEVRKDELKRVVFEVKQVERYNKLIKNEITMDEIEKEIAYVEDEHNGTNMFVSSRV